MSLPWKWVDMQASQDEHGFSYTWEAEVTAPRATANRTLLTDAFFPAWGAQHPTDDKSFVIRKRLRKVESLADLSIRWRMVVEFQPRRGSATFDAVATNEWPDIRFSFNAVDEVADKQADGTAILTTAKRPFDPPLTEPRYNLVIMMTRNVASYNPVTAYDYLNSVNNANVTFAGVTFAAWHGKLNRWEARPAARDETNYYIEDIEVELTNKAGGWRRSVLHHDTYQLLHPDDTNPTECLDRYKNPVSSPVPIDAQGKQIPSNLLPGAAHFEDPGFETKETKDWSVMNLPTTVFKP